ncbi:MAG: ABC transporter substrate-binding protein [Anaerolineales bacterium]|jgi:ABC-type transport system substrate-binding protein/tRNA A-37 threonylcarbamoyl transferase component Bud32
MIGKILNQRYRIDAEIGQGGMGTVYLGYDTILKRQVAIKLLAKSDLGVEGREKLISEAQVAAMLNHSNIVTVFDVGEEDAFPFIVMEYVEGKTLHEKRPETLEETLMVMRQLCAGLEYAHEQGIIHRDLKPENVVVTKDGTAKLMDFGLAKSIASRYTTEGILEGTVFYLAPEQALGQEIDQRADLYSLGVMMYELTTGELPFIAEDPIAVISQHIHAPVVPPRAKNGEISPLLDGLIVRLLSKDPKRRPVSAGEVKDILGSAEIMEAHATAGEEYSVLERIVRGRIVGREKELKFAGDLWQKTAAGDGQLLLIEGEAGIGKTRFCHDIVTLAEVSGGKALIGANYSEGGAPYGAIKLILRNVLSLDMEFPDEVLANLLVLNPELHYRYPDLKIPEARDPQAEQQSLFENLIVLFTTLADRSPLLLVIEDAQWADSGTLSVLRYLARNTRHQRVMTVITYREIDLDETSTFHEVLYDLDREGLASDLRLDRLSRKDSGELLAILFSEKITSEFLDGIYRETEGNPFFIEEVCKALVDSGKLNYEKGQWHRPSIEQLGIPKSVKVAVLTRVNKLPVDHQEILYQAAVLGREFDLDILTRASGVDEDTLIDALESAQRSQLIEEKSSNGRVSLAFMHALIPSTLKESLRAVDRRKMHKQAAIAIEEVCPEDFEALAFHFIEAKQEKQGVNYLIKAGDRARGLYAHLEAIKNYELAIEIFKNIGDQDGSARALMKLGLTYHNNFEFEKSRQAYEQGFIIWQRAEITRSQLPPAPHPLKVVYGEHLTLDPGRCIDISSASIIYQLFSGLVELSPDLSVIPDVAYSWDLLEGGRKYIFHLRDDVYWSDGVPVTAGDFEYAWRRILQPGSNPYFASILSDIQGAKLYSQGELLDPGYLGLKVVDDLTLAVELVEPTSYFMQLMAYVVAFPVPRHVVELKGEAWTDLENLVSNGPYKLVEYEPNDCAVFERNPTYHGVYDGNLELIDLRFSAQQWSNLIKLYESDDVDFIFIDDLPPREADLARQKYAEDYVTGPTFVCLYVGINVSTPPLDDKRVRQALTLAISRERLASIVQRGLMFPATGGLVPPGMPGHSPNIALPYDPENARGLLEKAGYPQGRGFPKLYCLAPDNPLKRTIAAELTAQWSQILGIEITWEFAEWGSFLDLIAARTQNIWLAGYFVDYPDPNSIFQVEYSNYRHISGWQNENYDHLVEGASRVKDQARRMNLYQQADRIVIKEAPIIPLLYGRFHMLIKPWIKHLIFSTVNPPLWKSIIIQTH